MGVESVERQLQAVHQIAGVEFTSRVKTPGKKSWKRNLLYADPSLGGGVAAFAGMNRSKNKT